MSSAEHRTSSSWHTRPTRPRGTESWGGESSGTPSSETSTGLYRAVNEAFNQVSSQERCASDGVTATQGQTHGPALRSPTVSWAVELPSLLCSLPKRNDLACLSLNPLIRQITKTVITSQDSWGSHISRHMSTIPSLSPERTLSLLGWPCLLMATCLPRLPCDHAGYAPWFLSVSADGNFGERVPSQVKGQGFTRDAAY